jgi:TatD DNase family protein
MFDTHAHYDDSRFDEDRDVLLNSLFAEKGVTNIINCGCDIASSFRAVEFAEKYKQIYAAAGIHPQEAGNVPDDYIKQLERLLQHKKVVAIGEIGLDYYYETPAREVQKKVFIEQMQLAERTGYPVIIHDRDAHKDCMDIALSFSTVKGVFHSYSGSPESMKILTKAGWYISISGVVTFKNAQKLPEVAATVDEDKLLVETDCPYLTPVPYRGKRNDSGYMEYTIKKIAELRGTTPEHIARVTAENAKNLFRIGDKFEK